MEGTQKCTGDSMPLAARPGVDGRPASVVDAVADHRPPVVHAGLYPVELVPALRSMFVGPQLARLRVHEQTLGIPVPVAPDLGQHAVPPDERVVVRHAAVVMEANRDPVVVRQVLRRVRREVSRRARHPIAHRLRPAGRRRGLNEAAGIPRGRRPRRVKMEPAEHHASMRPRVFPAEDSRPRTTSIRRTSSFNEAAGIPRGRLRPGRGNGCAPRRFNEAAGIPRGRHCPSTPRRSGSTRFNEAAGIPRGRRSRKTSTSPTTARFNEAAGIPRGRRATGRAGCSPEPRFNEAAGIPRGRRAAHWVWQEAKSGTLQ